MDRYSILIFLLNPQMDGANARLSLTAICERYLIFPLFVAAGGVSYFLILVSHLLDVP